LTPRLPIRFSWPGMSADRRIKSNFLELLTVNVKRERRGRLNLGRCTVVPGIYEKAPNRRII
jgi:hypothetical protein